MKKHEEIWSARIKEYRTSGKSLKAFCADNEFTIAAIKYWLYNRKLEQIETSNGENNCTFVSVGFADWPTDVGSGVSLQLKGITVNVERGFDKALLLEVVEALAP
ncbi:MAG: hypothetical protein FWG42_10865 [Clostridiales bacterium]|nr:hypothetical protein [Clostridiales bacterium]